MEIDISEFNAFDRYVGLLLADEDATKKRWVKAKHSFVGCFFRKEQFVHTGDGNGTLFFHSKPQANFIELITAIYEAAPGPKSLITTKAIKGINLHNMLQFIRKLPAIFKFRGLPYVSEDKIYFKRINLLDKLIIYTYYIRSIELVDEHLLANYSNVCVLISCWLKETFLIDLANEMGLETVTASHGCFTESGSKYWLQQPSSVFAINFVLAVNHLLLWGDDTKDLLVKYNPHLNIIACGIPTVDDCLGEKKNFIGVMFDGGLELRKYNHEMLKVAVSVAKKLNMSVKVRMHPSWKYEINEPNVEVTSDTDDCQIIIGHESSIVWTYMSRNYKTFRYLSDHPLPKLDHQICFRNSEELLVAIEKSEFYDFKKQSEPYILCCGEKSRQLYNNFFTNLNNKEAR